MVHGGELKERGWLNRRAAEYLDKYKKAQENLMTTNTLAGRHIWQAPPSKEYKLNFDAADFSDLQCSRFGAIIWNTNGEVMAGKSTKVPYVHNSEEAEVMACRKAIKFSKEAGFSRMIIEGDSLNVIRALSDSTENRSLLVHIYDDIKCDLRGMQVLSFSWVKRCGNMVAHSLVKHARNLLDDMYWIEDTPVPMADALYLDSLHINERLNSSPSKISYFS